MFYIIYKVKPVILIILYEKAYIKDLWREIMLTRVIGCIGKYFFMQELA